MITGSVESTLIGCEKSSEVWHNYDVGGVSGRLVLEGDLGQVEPTREEVPMSTMQTLISRHN